MFKSAISRSRHLLSRLKHLSIIWKTKGTRHTIAKVFKKLYLKLDDTSPAVVETEPAMATLNDPYHQWLSKHYPRPADLKKMKETVEIFPHQPVFSIIMPVYNTPERFLRDAIESVLHQIYPHWELCIADDASTELSVKYLLKEYAEKDSRIKVNFRTENGHISRASNSALELATGEYIALLDHDDLLTPDALYEMALLINRHPEADMIYSDEDKIDEQNRLKDPFFKPDWCPDSFLSRMYTCHLGVYRHSIIQEIGGFRVGYEGSQDYDLVLRFTEKAQHIFHIPKILYHWRVHPASTATGNQNVKLYAFEAAEKAITEAIHRRGEPGKVTGIPYYLGNYSVRYQIHDYKKVSVIIPTRDLAPVLSRCLDSIFTKTKYPHYEVIVIDNGSVQDETKKLFEKWKQKEPERFKCYPLDIPFNYPRLNNYATTVAEGEYFLFLNNDTEVLDSDWMEAMVEQAQRPSIGAVGALLLYDNDTIQHAGVILGIGDVAGHSHRHFPVTTPGYVCQVKTVNNYSAVTGACLMCRREVFESIGGFDEELAIAYNDVDLCLKMVEKGYRNVYLSHVVLYHYESRSRGYDDTPEKELVRQQEAAIFQRRWRHFIKHDPCYSPHLTRMFEDYRINI
jgi:glycosyltransferase involved in cell wall biosynthesis